MTLRAGLGLLIVAVLANLPVWGFDGWLGTEGRRVEIVREMAAGGDLVVPTLGLEPTLAKPPLFYWCLTAFESVFGAGQFAMRAPSVLSLWLLAWFAFCVLRRSHDSLVGWIGGLGVLCSPVIIYHGAFAEIDPMFAALTCASILLLGHGVGFGRRGALVLAGFFGSLALLTKGPPYLLFFAGSLLVWLRHARGRGLLWFIVPLAIAPTMYYVVLQNQPAAAELAKVAQDETVNRLFTYELSHVLDIPVHFVRAGLIMLPFALFIFAEYRGVHEAQLANAELQQRFCTSAALGSVILLAVFPGHAVRYLLPAVLLFNCGVAPPVCGFVRFPAELGPTPKAIVRWLGVLGGIALCVLPWLAFPLPGRLVWFAGALAVAPLLVHSRARLLAYTLAVPVLAAWTVLPDRARNYEHGTRSSADVQALLIEQLESLGAAGEVATYGHFTYSHAFDWPDLLPGDEMLRRKPDSKFLLVERRGSIQTAGPGYVDRVRIRGRRKTLVVQERGS